MSTASHHFVVLQSHRIAMPRFHGHITSSLPFYNRIRSQPTRCSRHANSSTIPSRFRELDAQTSESAQVQSVAPTSERGQKGQAQRIKGATTRKANYPQWALETPRFWSGRRRFVKSGPAALLTPTPDQTFCCRQTACARDAICPSWGTFHATFLQVQNGTPWFCAQIPEES